MRTSNPVLGGDAFTDAAYAAETRDVMTIQGTALKTCVLVVLAVASAAVSWRMLEQGHPATMGLLIGGLIGGLVLALVTVFKPRWAGVTAPLYAIAEGLFLGVISAMFNHVYEGIVFQAICLTFGTLFAMLMAYQSGWIKCTEKFRAGVVAATGAIMLVYIISMIMNLCGVQMPYLHSSGPIGIGISVVIVIIAALNLVLDFDFIDRGAAMGAPKYMEWYGAFGLMVTIVWLYIEILKLLAKLQSRD